MAGVQEERAALKDQAQDTADEDGQQTLYGKIDEKNIDDYVFA